MREWASRRRSRPIRPSRMPDASPGRIRGMKEARLVLAAALVHSVPGAMAVVVDERGCRVSVGSHPSADIGPCEWRRTVVEGLHSPASSSAVGANVQEITGSIEPSSIGGFSERLDPTRRWFAALVPPCVAVGVLRAIEVCNLPEQALSVVLRPDLDLGVSVVGLSIQAPCTLDALEELSTDIAASLAVAELSVALSVRN